MATRKPETSTATVLDQPPDQQLRIEWWPIDRPKPYSRNARKWSGEAITKLAVSIRTFGWRQPIVCDTQDVIVIGHLRMAAARYLGLAVVPVHVADNLSPDQIKALRIADNRTHEEAEWDTTLLSRDLIDLKIADFNLDITGFNTEEVAASVFGAFGGKANTTRKKGSREAEVGSDESDKLQTKFEVLVECVDEAQQVKALELLTLNGFNCRAQL